MAIGDSIFTERLKFYEVNDKLILNKVLLLGSSTVEVHELTKLRITDIQGIEKPEKTKHWKPSEAAGKKPEKVAVAA
nr:50s ribosomal protein l21, mitochondrial [Quercus suber]